MAHTTVYLTDGVELKKAPVGYSWTTLLFGGWPALFRQDWLWGICVILASILTYGLAGIVCSFFYNKVYIKSLIKKGYKFKETPGISDEQLKQYLGYIELPRA